MLPLYETSISRPSLGILLLFLNIDDLEVLDSLEMCPLIEFKIGYLPLTLFLCMSP